MGKLKAQGAEVIAGADSEQELRGSALCLIHIMKRLTSTPFTKDGLIGLGMWSPKQPCGVGRCGGVPGDYTDMDMDAQRRSNLSRVTG